MTKNLFLNMFIFLFRLEEIEERNDIKHNICMISVCRVNTYTYTHIGIPIHMHMYASSSMHDI